MERYLSAYLQKHPEHEVYRGQDTAGYAQRNAAKERREQQSKLIQMLRGVRDQMQGMMTKAFQIADLDRPTDHAELEAVGLHMIQFADQLSCAQQAVEDMRSQALHVQGLKS